MAMNPGEHAGLLALRHLLASDSLLPLFDKPTPLTVFFIIHNLWLLIVLYCQHKRYRARTVEVFACGRVPSGRDRYDYRHF